MFFIEYVEKYGSHDLIAYARRMGIFQVSKKDDTERLDLRNAMTSLSVFSIWLFFDFDLKSDSCEIESRKILCINEHNYYTFSEIFELSEISETLTNLHTDAHFKERIAKNFVGYLKMKKPIQDQFQSDNSTEPAIFTIKEIYDKYPSKHLDWLPLINNLLLNDVQKTMDDEISISNPKLFDRLFKLFVEQDEA